MINKKNHKILQEAINILNNSNEVDLATPGMGKAVAKRLLDDIDEYCVNAYDDGHRTHLGASLIGHECSRYLWGIFRWLKHEETDGRKQRLFNRGHREEARFIEWLEGIGCQVYFEDRDSDPLYFVAEDKSYYLGSSLINKSNLIQELATLIEKYKIDGFIYDQHIIQAKAQGIEFKQYRISDVGGHFGGSLDCIIILPPRYGINEPILGEFKTNGTGQGFNKLTKDGMGLAKPQHFAQTSVYGYKGIKGTQFRYVLYLNINKNDDDIHCEIVKLNHATGEQMIQKAERIITSQVPPSRLSDNPTFLPCTWCAQKEICHQGAAPEVNCRSCKHALPRDNAEWFCEVHNGNIPKEFIPQACPQYKAITDV